MRNVLASLREFWAKVLSHTYVLVVGVLGGVLGLASLVYGDLQPPNASPLVPLWIWLPLFGIAYGVAVIWAFHDVRVERDAMKHRAETAESALETAHADLGKVQLERDEARRELEGAQRAAIPPKPELPPFELRYYTSKAPDGWATLHFVGVKNPPGQPERQARMSAKRMDPYPQENPPYPGVRPEFPYAVPPASGGTTVTGLIIRPGQEESWLIGKTGISGDGKINVWRFFRDLDASWELRPDEHWRLDYRIECDGVPDVPFSIVLASEDGHLKVRLED